MGATAALSPQLKPPSPPLKFQAAPTGLSRLGFSTFLPPQPLFSSLCFLFNKKKKQLLLHPLTLSRQLFHTKMTGGELQKVKLLSASSSSEEMEEELQKLELVGPMWKSKKRLSKQLSMCGTPRDAAWERRRHQILRRKNGFEESDAGLIGLTDEDLCELKGSIELGFGFNEEDGQSLCNTLPALDLYFAVNRRFSSASCSSLETAAYKHRGYSPSPISTPRGSAKSSSSSAGSPRSESDSWKICNPGDKPQQVKTKLRHWAQAVACSVRQSY